MSLIILFLIIIMLYATLSKYGSVSKVIVMSIFIFGLTLAFLLYGIRQLALHEIFQVLNTQMNLTVFIHACTVWFIADIIVLYKIVTNYRFYVEINSK